MMVYISVHEALQDGMVQLQPDKRGYTGKVYKDGAWITARINLQH